MEKSIEKIWKEGFLKSDALVAPRLNDIYNKKSKHIIEKSKRLMAWNLYFLVIFAVVVFVGYTFFFEIPLIGFLTALVFIIIAFYAKKQMRGLIELNYGSSSFEYITAFNTRLNNMISYNSKYMRMVYPICFILAMATIWYSNGEDALMHRVIEDYPNMWYLLDVPVWPFLGVLLIAGVMFYFGDKIYRWDVNLVYGRVFQKLETMIRDMEELRA